MNKKKEQIRQLLELAANTPYPEEAKLAQERAEILMVRYNISIAEAENSVPSEYTNKIYYLKGIYAKAIHFGLYYAVDSFNTTVPLVGNTPSQQYCWVNIYGNVKDVDSMIELCESLEAQSRASMKFWWKENKSNFQHYSSYQQRMFRESYLNFFFNGVASRVKEVVSEEVKTTNSQDLVVSHKQKAKDYLDSQIPNIKTKKHHNKMYEASSSGYTAGYNASLSGKKISKNKTKELV